jgi:hypothetical protein
MRGIVMLLSSDVKIAAECFADNVARRGVIGVRARFDGGAQVGIKTNRYDVCWAAL